MGTALAHKTQKRLDAEFTHLFGDTPGRERQRIEQVRQAHQRMLALQGIPIVGEGMLVAVTLALLDLHTDLDTKAAGERRGYSGEECCRAGAGGWRATHGGLAYR